MNEEIYNKSLRSGTRTYFFDVKKTSKGELYLDIKETRMNSDGTYDHHSIMIFNEAITQFKNETVEIYEKFFAKT